MKAKFPSGGTEVMLPGPMSVFLARIPQFGTFKVWEEKIYECLRI